MRPGNSVTSLENSLAVRGSALRGGKACALGLLAILFAFGLPGRAWAQKSQTINFAKGVSYVSLNVLPADPDFDAILGGVKSKIILVMDDSGRVYIPSNNYDGLSPWKLNKGYKFYTSAAGSFTVTGPSVTDAVKPVTLAKGWNLVPFNGAQKVSIQTALGGVMSSIAEVRDASGKKFSPTGNSTLAEFTPGQSYWINMKSASSVQFAPPAAVVPTTPTAPPPVATSPGSIAYNPSCVAQAKHVKVHEYGALTFGARADSTQRSANTKAINAAIAAAPVDGYVCLPADSLYLTLDRLPTAIHGTPVIDVSRDRITLMGAGACGWGNVKGCTYLGTPGDKYFYRGQINGDKKDHLARGHGIVVTARPARGDSLRNIAFKGFELDGHSGWTGNYGFNYDWIYWVHWNGWDMGHKGIIIGSDRNITGVVLEDIKVHHYKGEVIYQGGFGTGTVRLNRVWSYESNGSAHNFATAKYMVVENSKFGPNVRFWGEYLAEGIEGAVGTFRNNTYEGCMISAGCIAMAVQSSGTTIRQTWTWEDNTFTMEKPNMRAFYVSSGRPYTLRIKNNTFEGGGLWITGGSPSIAIDVDVSGNALRNTGDPFIWQQSAMTGRIARNDFRTNKTAGGQMYKFSASPNLSNLVIEDNYFEGYNTNTDVAGFLPLARSNRFGTLDFWPTTDYNGGRTINTGSEVVVLQAGADAASFILGTMNAHGQRILVRQFGPRPLVMPPHTNHTWTTNVVVPKGGSKEFVFDKNAKKWSVVK